MTMKLQMSWVVVTGPDGRDHLEMRWVVPEPAKIKHMLAA